MGMPVLSVERNFEDRHIFLLWYYPYGQPIGNEKSSLFGGLEKAASGQRVLVGILLQLQVRRIVPDVQINT